MYVLDGFSPSANALNKVMAVRVTGVAANSILGDGIKNGVPFDLGVKFHKTPTEHLYSLDLAKYAYQRTAYVASVAMWPTIFAVGMTLAMPYTAPLFMSLGGALTSAAGATSALGGLSASAAAHSSILGGAVGLSARSSWNSWCSDANMACSICYEKRSNDCWNGNVNRTKSILRTPCCWRGG